jgi:NAD+ synthase (glutamine-hydrolysing)
VCRASGAPEKIDQKGSGMRVALAQIDVVVGDITGNAERVLAALAEGERVAADLVIAPELTLTGYPPEDLLAKTHFIEENLDALERIASACTSTSALIGFVERSDGVLHNAAALCREGRIARVYRKRLLPNYGVFDEERYFEPGQGVLVAEIEGLAVSPTICEDIWMPGIAAEVAGAGASLLVNISASPFHAGKGVDREAMLRVRAADNGVWLAYCNLVGGQDELVFDGRSALISPAGEVVARAASFAEDFIVADIPPAGAPLELRVEPMPSGAEEIYGALCLGLGDYVRKNGFTDVVIGLSGGIDSALTAAVAADALGPDRVHGVTMPSRYSSAGSVEDSHALAANLGIECIELPIEGPFSAMLDTLQPLFEGRPADVTEENLQARVRGTLLMALSNKFGWLVLATGNKSELSVGYSTLYGDMVGGFAPLKDVFKTRVYELARWRNRHGEIIPRSTVDKPPSAELRPDQTDQDTLPPYDVLDAILAAYVEEDLSRERIAAQGHDEQTVQRVCRMVDASEYKRRQGPLGIRVTPKAFGKDRRMPVTNRYRG